MAKKATPKTKSEIMAALAAAGEISKKQAATFMTSSEDLRWRERPEGHHAARTG
jgi:hypothetical protein